MLWYSLAGNLNAYFLYRSETDTTPFYGELVMYYPKKRHVSTTEWKRLSELWNIMKGLNAVDPFSNITSTLDAVYMDTAFCN